MTAEPPKDTTKASGLTGTAPGASDFDTLITSATGDAPPHFQTLQWLAGGTLSPQAQTLLAREGSPDADVLFDTLVGRPPPDPVEAARRRAVTLPQLQKLAPSDPRVAAIFAEDPIIVEDTATSALVTKSMVSARLKHFDMALDIAGQRPMGPGPIKDVVMTLRDAFADLSIAAQIEWTLSEMRLIEAKSFLKTISPVMLEEVSTLIDDLYRSRGIWSAARAFAFAAHAAKSGEPDGLEVGDLLEWRGSEREETATP